MPSLHAAFPWLVLLTLWHVFGRKALWSLPYCLALWLSIMYLGEHYAIDAVAGIAYVSIVYWVGLRAVEWITTPFNGNNQQIEGV